jgi:hypothetical protein
MGLNKYINNASKSSSKEKKEEYIGFKVSPSEARAIALYVAASGSTFSSLSRKAWGEYMQRHPIKK